MKTLIAILVFSTSGSTLSQTESATKKEAQPNISNEMVILKKQLSFEAAPQAPQHKKSVVKPSLQFHNVPTEWVKVK